MNEEKRRPILLSVVQYENALQTGAMTPSDVIGKAAALGLDGVELRPIGDWTSDKAQIAGLRELAHAHGLIVTYATMSRLFTPDSESIQAFIRDVDVARDLGAGLLRVFSGTPPDDNSPYYRSVQLEWEGAAMNLDYAKQQNVLVVLENAPPDSPPNETTVGGILAQLWNPAELQTNVDIGNYARARENVVETIRALGPRIVSTHLKDLPFDPSAPATGLGEGNLPLDAILNAFAELPQRILHIFEFAGSDNPDARIQASLRYLRARGGRF